SRARFKDRNSCEANASTTVLAGYCFGVCAVLCARADAGGCARRNNKRANVDPAAGRPGQVEDLARAGFVGRVSGWYGWRRRLSEDWRLQRDWRNGGDTEGQSHHRVSARAAESVD